MVSSQHKMERTSDKVADKKKNSWNAISHCYQIPSQGRLRSAFQVLMNAENEEHLKWLHIFKFKPFPFNRAMK